MSKRSRKPRIRPIRDAGQTTIELEEVGQSAAGWLTSIAGIGNLLRNRFVAYCYRD